MILQNLLKILHQGKIGDNVAVIASKQSAEKYGLKIVDPDIHDLKKNLTLFLAVERLDKNE
ncbi:MAG: hypothetical protein Ct9H90mP15_03200 [Candidatus Neomarinimicrobiota bacterium]|nr:MAG: hypothetical protein Ct9H90mP15_03200 [Candidatus Neomarinimicrobiota bacterium]